MDLTVPFVKYFVVGINQLIRKIKIILESLCSGKHLEREQVEREVPRRDQAGHSHLEGQVFFVTTYSVAIKSL